MSITNSKNVSNYLSSNRATLTFAKIQGLNLTAQEITLPNIELQSPIQSTPFIQKPLPGETLSFGNLDVTFIVNEDLSNWHEIYKWMRALASPTDKSECKNIDFVYSDAFLTFFSSHNNPIFRVHFIDVIPISLGMIEFSEQDTETIRKVASASFKYERYDPQPCGMDGTTTSSSSSTNHDHHH